jgi:hypothetical protein
MSALQTLARFDRQTLKLDPEVGCPCFPVDSSPGKPLAHSTILRPPRPGEGAELALQPTGNAKPDPPQGQRSPHRYLAPEVAESLRRARRRRGWSFRRAGRAIGVNPGYLCYLEQGRRVPSVVVAEALIDGLKLDRDEAADLRAVALYGVGRDFDLINFQRARVAREK